METRRFEQKKTILAGLVLFLGIVFLGLTDMLLSGEGPRFIVVFGFMFCFLGLLVGLYILVKGDFTVEISDEGVRAWVLGKELLPWSEIDTISSWAPKIGSWTVLTLIELRFREPKHGAPGLIGDLFPGWAAKQTRDAALLNDLTVKAPAHEIMAALEAGLAASRARNTPFGTNLK